MTESAILFQITDWTEIPATVHKGETGEAYWRTRTHSNLRLRMVVYSPGYKADHWCSRGHIIYCIEGEMTTELSDGSSYAMKEGMTYEVSDYVSWHRSFTENGAKLFIIDGAFLDR
jgi:quercetin dioxygenase-like cupin family protein